MRAVGGERGSPLWVEFGSDDRRMLLYSGFGTHEVLCPLGEPSIELALSAVRDDGTSARLGADEPNVNPANKDEDVLPEAGEPRCASGLGDTVGPSGVHENETRRGGEPVASLTALR